MHTYYKRALAGFAAVGLIGVGATYASAAPTEVPVRAGDLIRDSQVNGSFDFLAEGLHIQSDAGGYAIGRFPVGVPLADAPTIGSEWFGTDNEPGLYYEIDADADGQWDGQLIAEKVYGTTDAWLNRDVEDTGHDTGYTATLDPGFFATNAPCDGGTPKLAGATCGSSGAPKHGDLADWAKTLKAKTGKDPVIKSGGFAQAGGNSKANGVLRSITYGPKSFVFSDAEDTTPPTDPKASNVTGDVVKVQRGRSVSFSMRSDKLPAGTVQGDLLTWRLEVNGSSTSAGTQGATTEKGQYFGYSYYCPQTATCKYVVKKNGVVQGKVTTVVAKQR